MYRKKRIKEYQFYFKQSNIYSFSKLQNETELKQRKQIIEIFVLILNVVKLTLFNL